jgi:hypothetical protein
MKESRMKSDGMFEAGMSCFYARDGRLSVIGFKGVRGMDVPSRLPSVIAFGIAFPLYEILQGFVAPESPMIADLLHFVFFFSFDKVRWRPGEVGAVCGSFAIGR